MSTGENLRTYTLTDAPVVALINSRMYQNTIPETAALPFVWFMRRSVEFLDVLGEEEATPWREFFDIECVAETVDGAIDLADAVRAALQATSGAFGTGTIQWLSVRDHSDDYVVRNNAADDRLYVSSLDVEIVNQ